MSPSLGAIDGGRMWVDGQVVGYHQGGSKLYELSDQEIAAAAPRSAWVFQQFNLFPHMTVLENLVEAPRRAPKVPRSAAR